MILLLYDWVEISHRYFVGIISGCDVYKHILNIYGLPKPYYRKQYSRIQYESGKK